MVEFFKRKQLHANYGTSAMETGDHSKNGASPKNLMSRGNVFKLFFIVVTATLTISFFSCKDKDNKETNALNNDNSNNKVIEYKGKLPNPEVFLWDDGIDAFMVNAYPGFVELYSTNSKIKTLVEDFGGNIVEQIPDYGYFLVKVNARNENNFAKNMTRPKKSLQLILKY